MISHDAAASLRTGLERFLIVWLTVLCWIAYRWPAWMIGVVTFPDHRRTTQQL